MKENELEELIEKIEQSMDITRRKQANIDEKQTALREESRIIVVEEGKAEIEDLKKDKIEFDEMTFNAFIEASKAIKELKEKSEREYQEKLIESVEKRKVIEQKLESIRTNGLTSQKLTMDQVEKSAEKALEKLNLEMNEFQNNHFARREKLDNWEKQIGDWSIELGCQDKLNEKLANLEQENTEESVDEQPKTEPAEVEEPKTEPVEVEELKTEPVEVEEPKTEPVEVEEPKTEPVKSEEPKTEPAKAEEPKTEPAKPEQPKTEPVKAEQTPEDKVVEEQKEELIEILVDLDGVSVNDQIHPYGNGDSYSFRNINDFEDKFEDKLEELRDNLLEKGFDEDEIETMLEQGDPTIVSKILNYEQDYAAQLIQYCKVIRGEKDANMKITYDLKDVSFFKRLFLGKDRLNGDQIRELKDQAYNARGYANIEAGPITKLQFKIREMIEKSSQKRLAAKAEKEAEEVATNEVEEEVQEPKSWELTEEQLATANERNGEEISNSEVEQSQESER